MANVRVVGDDSGSLAAGVSSAGALATATQGAVLYNLAALAADAAIDSGVLDTANIGQLVVRVHNGNTTQTRVITVTFYAADGTTVVGTYASAALAASATGLYAFGWGAIATGLTAAWCGPVPPKVKVSCPAPASGAGVGAVSVWGR
jgi:hypothetical protein